MRKRMASGLDRKIFRHTAVKSKRINTDAPSYRGGIRL